MANDLTSILLKQLLSGDAISGISKTTNASTNDVSNILATALPSLLMGATQQANTKTTSNGFADALLQHSASDTSNLSSFFNNVDLNDGAKIVQHLLGSNTASTTKSIASTSKTNNDTTKAVLAAAAPLLMSLLGKQVTKSLKSNKTTATNKTLQPASSNSTDVSSLASSLLGSVDTTSLLTSLLTGGTSKKKKSGIDLSDGLDVSDILGIASKLMK